MHRTHSAIEDDIAASHRLIAATQRQLSSLYQELNTARALELAGRSQQGRIAHVLERFETGEQIVTTPRAWWCRDGQLIEKASGDDLEALATLTRQNVIETTHR
ncbi:MAG: hypothetical protein VX796_16635 [Pseudomonadota bacterium]|nr:hypothetical protein [Pseudomonadota bacterium]